MTKRLHLFILLANLPALLIVTPSLADEVEYDTGDIDSVKCIRVRSLRSTKIVDDRNVIFFMLGNKTYLNVLPRQCHGLARQGRFGYETRTGSLCNLDTIQVLYQGGIGLESGISCRIGLFHPISKEDADALLNRSDEPLRAEPIPLPDPEEISGEDEESGDEQTI